MWGNKAAPPLEPTDSEKKKICSAQIQCVPKVYLRQMKLAVGNFAKVMVKGREEITIIDQITYHNGKLYEIRCCALDEMWHRGFYPDEIIEVIENPEAHKRVEENRQITERMERFSKPSSYVVYDKGKQHH